jgi:hypothetical protein
MYHAAVQSVGRDVLVIKHNKIIGKGRVEMQRDSVINVKFIEGEILDMIQNLELVKSIGIRYSYFKFLSFTGTYFDTDDCTGVGGEDILSDVVIVDEFNFNFGLVPAHFSKVPGYRSAFEYDVDNCRNEK